ncbi:MAG: hypothetical protein HY553_00620 [Elusimicrobia bacterium]|nr:hypothetical protein [Elusimicrobiota bacterium]
MSHAIATAVRPFGRALGLARRVSWAPILALGLAAVALLGWPERSSWWLAA